MPFSSHDVEDLGARGPGWLSQRRLAAWEFVTKLDLPGEKEEPWRYTDLARLGFELDAFSPVASAEELPEPADLEPGRSGILIERPGHAAQRSLDPALEAQGVVLTDLETALVEHADVLEPLLLAESRASDNLIAALHESLVGGGCFLRVPKGLTVPLPVESRQVLDTPGAGVFPHTVVVVEEDAEVVFFERYTSPAFGAPSLVVAELDVVLGPRARARVVSLQEQGPSTWHFARQRSVSDRAATLQSLVVSLGGRFARTLVETVLRGEHATSEMLGLYFAGAGQHFDFRTLQDHVAPSCTSDLLFKGALRDDSRTVYSGLIRVNAGAAKTDAYQANRNLVLSDAAKADSKPELEILNNDVRCTHGSTVGQIDEEQLFYLQCRGISRHDAERLIVKGFFEDVIGRLTSAELRELLEASIEAKMEA